VDGDDPEIFHALLEAAYAEARARRYVYVVAGLAARHEWNAWLEKRFNPRVYTSVLYAVLWDEETTLDGRMPHVEVALL
jgi:hypothetical protein